MVENKNSVKLGDGVADSMTQTANKELAEMGNIFITIISKYIKDKIKEINLDELFSKKNEEGLVQLWSKQLIEKELIPQGYIGLSEQLLVDNMHQDGYLNGIYVGYILAMMSLVDNEASKDLILSVRDDMRPNLTGHHYNNRDEFIKQYKSDKYDWIDKSSKDKTLK